MTPPRTVAEIITAVALKHSVSASRLAAPGKVREFCGPRHEAMWLAVELLVEDVQRWRIGAAFHRTWPSVVYGHAQHAERRGDDERTAEQVWAEMSERRAA